MKIDKRNPQHWVLLLQQAAYTLLAMLIRPFVSKPKKPVVILYGHQLSGNLKALYEQWQLSYADRFSLYFLSLDPQQSARNNKDGVAILKCDSLPDMLMLARASAVITDHGLHMMTPLAFFTDIFFIDVWHGIPFKGFTPEDFWLQRHYDEIWVSSPLLKHVYETKFNFKSSIVKDQGYARTDKLFQRQPPDQHFRKSKAIPEGHRVVLYAPTWQQDDKGRELFPFGESQNSFIQCISKICHKHQAILVIRSHLNASINTETFDNVRYCSMRDYPDAENLLQNTDILICDWSSIAFDFLALNRPTLFLDVEPPFKNGFSLGGEFRFGNVVTDMTSLVSYLVGALENPQAYFSSQTESHNSITQQVYGNNTDGKVAIRQLDRLISVIAPS